MNITSVHLFRGQPFSNAHKSEEASQKLKMSDALGIARLKPYLSTVAAGSNVAVITFIGSFCPVTLGHIQCVQIARDILTGATKPVGTPLTRHFDACVAIICCNPDNYVSRKMARQKQQHIPVKQRQRLIYLGASNLSTCEGQWLTVVDYFPHQFKKALSCDVWQKLCAAHPSLNFVHVSLGGADDILTRKKWNQEVTPNNRMLTMVRFGS